MVTNKFIPSFSSDYKSSQVFLISEEKCLEDVIFFHPAFEIILKFANVNQNAMLMKTRVILIAIIIVVCNNAFAYDFSAVCESGQTLYYEIISTEPNEVQVVAPSDIGYHGNAEPVGDIIIPSSVTYNDESYSVVGLGYIAFYLCGGITSVVLPESIRYISWSAFFDNFSLQHIEIPNTVTSIGQDAFAECSSLTSIILPNLLENIETRLFMNCDALSSIIIPNSVTSIGIEAFAGCNNLSEMIIPGSVTSIGEGAFYWCSSLDTIYCNAINPPSLVSANTFPSEILKIFVPCDCLSAYTNAEYWSELTNILQEHPDCPSSKVHENEISDLHIFPNPTSNILNITSPEEISEIEIVNVMGQIVYRKDVNRNNAVCDVEGLANGMYVVRIRPLSLSKGADVIQKKFIKE